MIVNEATMKTATMVEQESGSEHESSIEENMESGDDETYEGSFIFMYIVHFVF